MAKEKQVIEAEIVEEANIVLKPISFIEAKELKEVALAEYRQEADNLKGVDIVSLDNKGLGDFIRKVKPLKNKLVKVRTTTEKIRKELKAPALEYGRLVDSKAKEVLKGFTEIEDEVTALYNKADKELEARKHKIEMYIKGLKIIPLQKFNSSKSVKSKLDELKDEPQKDEFGSYYDEAIEAYNIAKKYLNNEFNELLQKEQREAEEAERKAKEEAERKAKEAEYERAKKEKEEAERKAKNFENVARTLAELQAYSWDKIETFEDIDRVGEDLYKFEQIDFTGAEALKDVYNSILKDKKDKYKKEKNVILEAIKKQDEEREAKVKQEQKFNIETIDTEAKPETKANEYEDLEDYINSLKEVWVKVRADNLAKLITASTILEALEIGGVDNWEWYGESYPSDEVLLEKVKESIEKFKEANK